MAGGSSPDTTPASANNPGFSSPLSLAMPMLNQGGAGNPFAALMGQIIRGAAQTPLQANPRASPGGDQQFNDFMMQVMNASQPQTYVPQTSPTGTPAPVPTAAAAAKKKPQRSGGGNGSPSGRSGDSAGSRAGG